MSMSSKSADFYSQTDESIEPENKKIHEQRDRDADTRVNWRHNTYRGRGYGRGGATGSPIDQTLRGSEKVARGRSRINEDHGIYRGRGYERSRARDRPSDDSTMDSDRRGYHTDRVMGTNKGRARHSPSDHSMMDSKRRETGRGMSTDRGRARDRPSDHSTIDSNRRGYHTNGGMGTGRGRARRSPSDHSTIDSKRRETDRGMSTNRGRATERPSDDSTMDLNRRSYHTDRGMGTSRGRVKCGPSDHSTMDSDRRETGSGMSTKGGRANPSPSDDSTIDSKRRETDRGMSTNRGRYGKDSRKHIRGQHSHSQGRGFSRPNTNFEPISMSDLQNLLQKTPEAMTMKLFTPSSGYENALQLDCLSDNHAELMIKVTGRMCETQGKPSIQSNMLRKVNSSGFISKAIIPFLSRMTIMYKGEETIDVLRAICSILEGLLLHIPAASTDNVTPVLGLLQSFSNSVIFSEWKDHLDKCIHNLMDLQKNVVQQIHGGNLVKENQKDSEDYTEPPENFRQISVAPTAGDMVEGIEPFLRKNRIHGSYRDVDQYLDIQFRLLREDYLMPLRQGIKEIRRAGDRKLNEQHIQDVRIYNNVYSEGMWYSQRGTVHRLKLDTSKTGRINWENSRRLKYGALVCLSTDKFQTFKIGTVIERDPKLLKKGVIDIILIGQQLDPNPCVVYQMVECSAYYEAYRHNLQGLQELNQQNLPFQVYLLNKNTSETRPPRYLRGTNASFDFSPIIQDCGQKRNVEILDVNAWPKAAELRLDNSQYKAIQLALTKEFAIIQGPPGTGKTYIGLKIAHLLLHNFDVWGHGLRDGALRHRANCPILLVCYTNHALDQFVEGILEFTPHNMGKIVRVGGRSSSDNHALKNCLLSSIKHDKDLKHLVPAHLREAKHEISEEMTNQEKYLSDMGAPLNNVKNKIIHEEYLSSMMSPLHREQFKTRKNVRQFSIFTWLLDLMLNEHTENEGEEQWDPEDAQQQSVGAGGADLYDTDTIIDEVLEEEANVIEQERHLDDWDNEKEQKLGVRSKLALNNNFAGVAIYNVQTSVNPNNDEWKIKRSRKDVSKIIKRELLKSSVMSNRQESTVHNLWTLPAAERWNLYRLWIQRLCVDVSYRIRNANEHYNDLARQLEEIRVEEDYHLMSNARVIAMTTTGAARCRHLLRQIKPCIVIVEEAAEVMESHIVTSLTDGCQHLILIGDHQQLRPKPTVYKLAKNYNLDVSLFERMIQNDMQCECLMTQHRMRPEIVELIVPHIYKELQNHESVFCYESIKGICGNLFFINHSYQENHTFDSKSKSNTHEAEYLFALCKYLILQGYDSKQITILSTYTGQMFEIKKRTRNCDIISSIYVTPVDNYQGEENDIILLSLVRSNEEGRIGFLSISNRVCVALSRAKMGLYVIGNMDLLEESSPLWKAMMTNLRCCGKLVDSLPLVCQNHPNTGIKAQTPEDFAKAPEGGCMLPCEFRLKCGHVCDKLCHPVDPKHVRYQCKKKCSKILCKNQHICPKLCYENCGLCEYKIEKQIPNCEHIQLVPCHMDPYKFTCKHPCDREKTCSHVCPKLCYQDCGLCEYEVEKRIPKCGHLQLVPCHMDPSKFTCLHPCVREKTCNHVCPKLCYQDCGLCEYKVEKRIPKCRHLQLVPCHMDPLKFSCRDPCDEKMTCGHICPQRCGEKCLHADECCVVVEGRQWPCGHILDVACHFNEQNYSCHELVEKVLPCEHTATVRCSANLNEYICKMTVHVQCERGCKSDVACYMQKQISIIGCQVKKDKVCIKNKKHTFKAVCSSFDEERCTLVCGDRMPCGHKCTGICGDCVKNAEHEVCKQPCQRLLPCSHMCTGLCREICGPCKQQCLKGCVHDLYYASCLEDRRICKYPCAWSCQHKRCNKRCDENCDRSPCDIHCYKRLQCGHQCVGYCGDPCPLLCRDCDNQYFEQIGKSLEIHFQKNERFVQLYPCNHVVPRRCMHQKVHEFLKNYLKDTRNLDLFKCPMCSTPVTFCPRYNDAVRRSQTDLRIVKKLVAKNHKIIKKLQNVEDGPSLYLRLSELCSKQKVSQYYMQRCVGCLCLLGEVFYLINRIKQAKQKQCKSVIAYLEEMKTGIMTLVSNYIRQRCEEDLDKIVIRASLLFLLGHVYDMLTNVKNRTQKFALESVTTNLRESLSMFESATEMKKSLQSTNQRLLDSIPFGMRNGIHNYVDEIQSFFKISVGLTTNIKWRLCNRGHAYPVGAGSTDATEHICKVCEAGHDLPVDDIFHIDDDSLLKDAAQRPRRYDGGLGFRHQERIDSLQRRLNEERLKRTAGLQGAAMDSDSDKLPNRPYALRDITGSQKCNDDLLADVRPKEIDQKKRSSILKSSKSRKREEQQRFLGTVQGPRVNMNDAAVMETYGSGERSSKHAPRAVTTSQKCNDDLLAVVRPKYRQIDQRARFGTLNSSEARKRDEQQRILGTVQRPRLGSNWGELIPEYKGTGSSEGVDDDYHDPIYDYILNSD